MANVLSPPLVKTEITETHWPHASHMIQTRQLVQTPDGEEPLGGMDMLLRCVGHPEEENLLFTEEELRVPVPPSQWGQRADGTLTG